MDIIQIDKRSQNLLHAHAGKPKITFPNWLVLVCKIGIRHNILSFVYLQKNVMQQLKNAMSE